VLAQPGHTQVADTQGLADSWGLCDVVVDLVLAAGEGLCSRHGVSVEVHAAAWVGSAWCAGRHDSAAAAAHAYSATTRSASQALVSGQTLYVQQHCRASCHLAQRTMLTALACALLLPQAA
jgi:hypothetical protein